MRKIRIAQIGTSTNSHGNPVWSSLKKQSDLFEIVGYAFPEKEREKFPERMKSFEGYKELTVEEILADETIEAVTVETEEIYLTKYALMAAKAGKHIHMEKPGSQCLADFEEMIRIIRENGRVFHTGYMYRYNPFVMELMEQIKRGDLGEILCVEAQMNCFHPPETRAWLSSFKGGMTFFLGCHLIDLILQIMGMPERIIPLNKSTGGDGVTSEDFGMAVLEYPHGISFAKASALEYGGFERRQLVVTGTKGTVELKPLEFACGDGLKTCRFQRYDAGWKSETPGEWSREFDRYDAMMASFAAMVRGEKENPYTLDYELDLYKVILECCGGEME